MAVDVCLEGYYAIGHTIDGLLIDRVRYAITCMRPRPRCEPRLQTTTNGVRMAAGNLPFDNAKALWLVDVCGSSYADASREMGCSTEHIADLVAGGRTQIRQDLGI